MGKSTLRLVTPSTVFGAVAARPPRKRGRTPKVRSREYLTEGEVERLIKAAGDNRHGHRDATLILVTFRHGFRTAEVTRLRWESVDFDRSELHVARVKGGSREPTRSPAVSCGCCVGSSASRSRHRPSCSRRSAGRRSLLEDFGR